MRYFDKPFHPLPSVLRVFAEFKSPDAIVKLTLLNCGEMTTRFVQFRQRDTPEEMAEQERCVISAWVIEKALDGETERYLWDAGVVHNPAILGPEMAAYMSSRFIWDVPSYAQPPEIFKHLSPPPVTLDTLTGIIISHAHMDHVGVLTDFPEDIPLIVGCGTKAWMETAPPERRPMPLEFWLHPKSKYEVGEDGAKGKGTKWEMIGAYEKGWDFFGDGSLYLIQAPGHCPGHQSALCRVSTGPDTYVLVAGDSCHSRYIYEPYPSPSARATCACFALPHEGPAGTTEPSHTMHDDDDLQRAYQTIARLTRMEMEENIIAVVSHETEVVRELDVKVGAMKQGWEKWKENGWKKVKESGVRPW